MQRVTEPEDPFQTIRAVADQTIRSVAEADEPSDDTPGVEPSVPEEIAHKAFGPEAPASSTSSALGDALEVGSETELRDAVLHLLEDDPDGALSRAIGRIVRRELRNLVAEDPGP
jgi:hypothetical protein